MKQSYLTALVLLAAPVAAFAIQTANPVSTEKEVPAQSTSSDATATFEAKRAALKKKHQLKKKEKAEAAEKAAAQKATAPKAQENQAIQSSTDQLQKTELESHPEDAREDKKK